MPRKISRAAKRDDQRLLALIASRLPIAKHAYFDKLAFWIENEFTDAEKDFIQAHCGPGDTDLDDPKWKRRSRFDPKLIQRVEVRQPDNELVLFLSKVPGLFLNMAEITLDLIFDSEEDRDAMCQFFDRHLIKRGHRGEVAYEKGTRYTDRRWAPTNLVMYRPEHAKLTGELNCLHVEWRVSGIAALRRMGINSVHDLLEFDHTAHWRKRLDLREFDFARLGRTYSNGHMKQRQHMARGLRVHVTKCGFRYPIDLKIGQVLWRCEETVQNVIDHTRKKGIVVSTCLREINNSLLLPRALDLENAGGTMGWMM